MSALKQMTDKELLERAHAIQTELCDRGISPDWLVGTEDLAKRLGVTRQAISIWRRRHSDFPMPLLDHAKIKIWYWPDVIRWVEARHG